LVYGEGMSVRVVRVGRLGYGLLAVYGNLAVSDDWMVNVSDLRLSNIPTDEVGDRLVGDGILLFAEKRGLRRWPEGLT